MIRRYLRHRWQVFAVCLFGVVVFACVQGIYGLPLAPVGYAALMLTFVLAIALSVDFARFSGRMKVLKAVQENLSGAAHALPSAADPIEAAYRDITQALYALLHSQTESLVALHEEQVAYYTLWMHQIKTPVSAMRLILQEDRHALQMRQELFKIERYIEMALQFVKMQDLSSDLVPQEYPLAPMLSASVKKYAPLFIGKKLSVDITPTDMTVQTDQKWFSFILEQLLSNAIKYTEKGGIRMYVEDGALVVEDSGIGIVPEDINRIFEKGYTGYNGRMDARASGLGLYMSKRIAGQLGIRIYPESVPGKGTKMKLVFPGRTWFLQE